jgi:hypothetical protein
LIGLYHGAQLFRVKMAGEAGGVHQITEQHRELAPLGLRGARCGRWRGLVRGVV